MPQQGEGGQQLLVCAAGGGISCLNYAGLHWHAVLRCSMNTAIAFLLLQVLGGNGYTNDYPTGRLLRDAKLYEIGAGTSEIRRMLIGRELFKLTSATH